MQLSLFTTSLRLGHVVVFLGNTGAGKSTLINYLAGKDLNVVGTGYVLSDPNDPEAMVIGTRVFSSETLYPKSIDIETTRGETLRFFDLPGLEDTDGSVRNLVNSAFVRRILLDAKTVRFVYVAGQDQFTADRGKSVSRTLEALNQLFVTAGTDRPLDGGMFVVTKEDGLLNDLANWKEVNMPEQLRVWKNAERIVPMYHSRQADRNTAEHRRLLLEQIRGLGAPAVVSVNVSSLYPQETQADIERMYRTMYERAYQHAEQETGASLSALKKTIELWQRDTFWEEFEAMYVYGQNPSVDVLKDLTIRSYNSVRNRYTQEQEVRRQANIQRIQTQIASKVEAIEEATKQRSEEIVAQIRLEQSQHMGLPPYDFANHQLYWSRVCGEEVLNRFTQDRAEHEVIRSAFARWIGEYSNKQISQAPVIVALQRQLDELSRQVFAGANHQDQEMQSSSKHQVEQSATASAAQDVAITKEKVEEIVIPEIAIGHEEIYRRFLRGKLVYKPNQNNDEGRKEFRISDLANPLSGTFDIGGCGDSDMSLSISTGFRTRKNPANEGKVEVWIVPQFVLQKDPRAKPYNDFLQQQERHRDKPFAFLYNCGGWRADDFDHGVTGVIGNEHDNLFEAIAHGSNRTPVSFSVCDYGAFHECAWHITFH